MNIKIDSESIENGVILFQSRSMSDPNLSDIVFENQMALVWTILNNFEFMLTKMNLFQLK